MSQTDVLSELHALYLEDEILIGFDGKAILEDLGFATVTLAHNLTTAKSHVASHRVDFALLDINLGDGTTSLEFGADLFASGVKVAFASGYNRSENIVCFAAPVIEKPYDHAAIETLVRQAMSIEPLD